MFSGSENDVVEYAKKSLTRPEDFGWYGREDMFSSWGFAGVTHAVNSGNLLEESNFYVISQDLLNKHPDDFEIVGIKHWAVGPMDSLIVKVLKEEGDIVYENITQAFEDLMEWHSAMADYAVADESDYSERELEENMKSISDTLSRLDEVVFMNDIDHDTLAAELYQEIVNIRGYLDYEEGFNEDDFYHAVANLNRCNTDAFDFWQEWAEDSKIELSWNPYTFRGGVRKEIPGQIAIDFSSLNNP